MTEPQFIKKTENYYLPSDVSDYIEQQAKRENRSPSNYLTTLIRRVRDSGNAS